MKNTSRKSRRKGRHTAIRRKVSGTADRPRACVMVSNKRIYVEFVDDTTGTTITSASSLRGGTTIGKTVEDARAVGTKAAEAARSKGIDKVLFDRGGHRFHGRVKAVADAMREAGLQL